MRNGVVSDGFRLFLPSPSCRPEVGWVDALFYRLFSTVRAQGSTSFRAPEGLELLRKLRTLT